MRHYFSTDDSLFRQIVETSAEGVWVVDLNSTTVYVNDRLSQLLGYPRAEMMGRTFADFLHPDELSRAQECFQRRKEGDTQPQEYRYIPKQGGIVWLSLTANPLRNREGEMLGVVAFCTDIAERKQADAAIRREHDRANGILESTSDAFMAVDRDWTITYVNSHAERFTRKSRAQLIGQNFIEQFPAMVESSFYSEYCRAREQGVPVHFEEFYGPLDAWFAVHAYPSSVAGDLAIYFQNINERKRKELECGRLTEQLESERALLREVIQQLPAGVVVAEAATGHVLLANKQVEKILRHPAIAVSGVEGYVRYGAIHPEDGRPYQSDEYPIVRSLLHGTVTTSEEQTYIRGDGSVAKLIVSASPIYDSNGRVVSSVAVFSDISDIKAMEAALRRANADLEQFAYAAAHDLQEPVRNMALYSELLARHLHGKLEQAGQEHLGVIGDSAKRILSLIKDLLFYTRVLAEGEQPDGRTRTEVGEAVTEVLALLKSALKEAEATVDVEHLPAVGVARVHLIQIFQNLIGNALKYRGQDPPQIRISAESHGHEWLLRVQDNGPGIAPGYHDQIFKVFKRLHGHEIPGTGIGLAICRRIVHHYGGRIWVDSQVSDGATFCFTLPAARETPHPV